MNDIAVLVVGNGLDLSLEMKTKISDFLDWVKTQLTNQQLLKIVHSQANIKCFTNFISYYNNWYETNDKVSNDWSDLENNIVDFFTNFKNDYLAFKKACKGKWRKVENVYWELRKGYEIFSFLMQYFYINEIKSISAKDSKKLKDKLIRLWQWLQKINIFISLNYTNIKDFPHKNTKFNFASKINIYYLHYISFGLVLDKYLRDLKLDNKNKKILNYSQLGDANEIFALATLDLDKKIRRKYCVARFAKSQHCITCSKFISGVAKYYQFLILGNSNTSHEIYGDSNYQFLFKNDNENLFLKNYPNLILNKISQQLAVIEEQKYNKFLYVFGYSFGEADFTFNQFLKNLIKDKKYQVKYVFFEEDKTAADLLKTNMLKCNSFYEKWNIDNKYQSLELFKENIEFI